MTSYCSLETFLLQLKPDDTVCALEADHTPRSRKQWTTRFHQWRQHLASEEAHRWALYHEDCFEFSAILLALWSLNKKVYLPGNNQSGHIEILSQHVDAFVGLIDDKRTIAPPSNDNALKVKSETDNNLLLTMEEERLYVFTSGSTGTPQAIGKTLMQISRELDTLHRQWGHQLDDVHITSSVSHQHIYGLLFRCLWPLLEGWSFDSHAKQYAETFTVPQNTCGLLISSPTHLSRLPSKNLASTMKLVFSSGAPLDYRSSQHAMQYFQCPVTEVLGSSETGGIAWRHQTDQKNTPWTTFDCVDFETSDTSQQLRIRSPYLPNPTQWFDSNDSAIGINDNQFILGSRVDRIIKVEGKRLSLDEMEEQLKQHTLVADAHLLDLDQTKTSVGAVICLNDPSAVDKRANRRALTETLKSHLLPYFERVTLPRKWRYVDRLPRNTQGKLNHQNMKGLFRKTEKPTTATLISSERTENDAILTLKIPEDLIYFEGHFDQSPILPGVVQLQWAEQYARNYFQLTGNFLRLEALKFQKIATPGMTLTLSLSFSKKNHKIVFKYTSPAGQHASGRIVLSPDNE